MSAQPHHLMTCWVSQIDNGLNWSQMVGCTLIIYWYLLSPPNKKSLWNILLIHGVSGWAGIFLETCFDAFQVCHTGKNVAWLLGVNEINWIIHETTTVAYSFRKVAPVLEEITENNTFKRAMQATFAVLFVVFAAFRIQIGILRVQDDSVRDLAILVAHSRAFIPWGIADLIVLSLMFRNLYTSTKKEVSGAVIRDVLASSMPRVLIICINTIGIVIVGQLYYVQDEGLATYNEVLWMIKGTYPLILLFDLLTTQTLLKDHANQTKKVNGSKSKSNSKSDSKHSRRTKSLKKIFHTEDALALKDMLSPNASDCPSGNDALSPSNPLSPSNLPAGRDILDSSPRLEDPKREVAYNKLG